MAHTQVSSLADDREFAAPALCGASQVAHATHVTRLSFRPETAEDRPFLLALYASTREAELAGTDWSTAQKAEFLRMQFGLQHRYYSEHFSDATFEIVQQAGQDIGRRYTLRRADTLTLIDMALLPQWRGQGIGTAMLQQLLDEATVVGQQVLLHVEHDNPARRIYVRAGFQEIGNNGVYLKLRWNPETDTSTLAPGTIHS